MALSHLHRAVAVGTTGLGLGLRMLAQVTSETADKSVGQIGAGTAMVGATYLLIQFVREAAPPFLKWAEIQAVNRNERVRMEEVIKQMAAQRDSDAAKIVKLEVRITEAEAQARHAENLVENAKIASDIRAADIEKKAREAGHLARNNAQKLDAAHQRLDDVEKAVTGSGDRDPESAL